MGSFKRVFTSASRTTMNSHGWVLLPDAAVEAASITALIFSSGTVSGLNLRTDLRVLIPFSSEISAGICRQSFVGKIKGSHRAHWTGLSRSVMKPKIAVDLDGVLAETMEAWCRIVNERFGARL